MESKQHLQLKRIYAEALRTHLEMFINANHNVLLYPQSITVETAILELCKEYEEEQMISKIRKDVYHLKRV